MANPDRERLLQNIRRMRSQGATDADIDRYMSIEASRAGMSAPAQAMPGAGAAQPVSSLAELQERARPEVASGLVPPGLGDGAPMERSAITGPYVPFVDDTGARAPSPQVGFDPGAGRIGTAPPEAMQAAGIGPALGMNAAPDITAETQLMEGTPGQVAARGAGDMARALAQGATLGFSDEMIAGLRSLAPGQDYETALTDERARLARMPEGYRTAGEVTGSLPLGFAAGGRIAAGKTLLGQMARGGTVAALTGAGYGFGTGEGGFGSRAGRAGTGALIGAATGLALPPLMAGVNKLAGGGRNLLNAVTGKSAMKGFTKAERESLRTIFKAFADDGIGPQEALKRLRTWRANGGAPAQLVDLGGPNVQRLARAIGTVGGPGATTIANEAERRLAQQSDEIAAALAKTLSGSGDDYLATVAQLDATRQNTARPLYEAAWAEQVTVSPRMKELLTRPHMQQSIGRAVADLIDAGDDPLTHGFVRTSNGQWTIGGRGTVKAFDFIKNATDDVLEGTYRNQVTGRLELDRRGNIWNSNLRELLGAVDDQSPNYAAARAAYAGPSKSREALEVGRGIFKGDYLAARQRIGRMTPGEREYARAGAVQAIRDKIDRVADQGNKASAILKTEDLRKRLRLLFDDDASYRRFEAMIRQEADRIDTATFIRPDVGSQTTPRKEDVFRYGLKSQAIEDVRSGKPVRSLMGTVGRRITDPFLNAAQQSRADTRGAALADMLFSNPQRAGILRALMQSAPVLPGPSTMALPLAGIVPAIGRALPDDPQRREMVRALAGQ